MNQVHLDNENSEITKELIGDFEVLVDRTDDIIAFEIATDRTRISIDIDSDFEVGKKLIEGLKEF